MAMWGTIGVGHGIALHCGQYVATSSPPLVKQLRLRCDVSDEYYTPDWKIDEAINRMNSELINSPYHHLYEWLKEKDPMLFKQWEAIYDITKGY